jgi:hypothetical protein
MHSHTRTENDPARFIERVTSPTLPAQETTWGCADAEIEEVRLTEYPVASYVSALQKVLGAPLEQSPVVSYSTETYGRVDYDARHVLPYLIDIFVSGRRDQTLGWCGVRRQTIEMLAAVWQKLGFTQPILVDRSLLATDIPGTRLVDPAVMCDQADAFVVDFGSPDSRSVENGFGGLSRSERRAIQTAFVGLVRVERRRMSEMAELRRIICLNAIHTPYEALVRGYIGAGLTPFATRMRHGFVLPSPVGRQEWVSDLKTGEAGERVASTIRAMPNAFGIVCYGPYRALLPGRYRIEFAIGGALSDDIDPNVRIGMIEFIWGAVCIDLFVIHAEDQRAGRAVLELDVDETLDPSCVVQTTIRTFIPSTLAITSVTCEEIERTAPQIARTPKALGWLGALTLGPAGSWNMNRSIGLKAGPSDFAAYGPYWTLVPGRYELCVDFASDLDDRRPLMIVEVYSDGKYRAVAFVNSDPARSGQCRLEFEVHEDEAPIGELPIEVRFRTVGAGGVIRAAKVRRTGEATLSSPWIPFPEVPSNWQSAAQDNRGRPRTLRSIVKSLARRLSVG